MPRNGAFLLVAYLPFREHARSGGHVHQSGGGHPPSLIPVGWSERVHMPLGAGYGTIWEYSWLVMLLTHSSRRYICWPSQRQQLKPQTAGQKEIFSGSVRLPGGSEIPLLSKAKYDHGTSHARNKYMAPTCNPSAIGVDVRLPRAPIA